MTTSAFKNGVFAADSQETRWNISQSDVKKIFIIEGSSFEINEVDGDDLAAKDRREITRAKGWLFSGAGNAAQIRSLVKFLKDIDGKVDVADSASYDEAPLFDCCVAYLIPPVANGTIVVFEAGTVFTRKVPEGGHFAIGSGSNVALGAMDYGADAHEAVAIAAGRDIHTGFPIKGYEIENGAWVELDEINSIEELDSGGE